jgi:acyl transferase domain-containing protein/NADPH:quinone reductase-like Zn-dependent oxidoreductase
VFKAMLSLERGIILPTAEVQTLNPKLKLDDWNIALPQGPLEWPTNKLRRISVNSFGFGGANAHVILDGAAQYLEERGLEGKNFNASFCKVVATNGANGNPPSEKQKLFVLSSHDEAGVARTAKSLSAYLDSRHDEHHAQYLSNLAYTLAFRRSELDYRSFAVAGSIQDLAQKLASPSTSLQRAVRRSAKHNRIAFVFTGQGAQWAGMGRQLYGEFDVFTESITRSSRCLESLGCEFNLEEELQRTEMSKIETAEYSQPICTAVQVALVDLLRQWRVFPGAVVGHSSGEIAAAYAARLITHEDAIKVAYIRGVYSGIVSKGSRLGAMLAAGISEEEANEYLSAVAPESVVVACVNSPKSVTLSGDADVITQLEASISADGKFARKLRVMTAYHSPHMRAVAKGCLQAMQDAGVSHITELVEGQEAIPMFSSVTGELLDPAELDPTYWIRNMCGTVRFSPAVANLLTGNVSSSLKRRTTGRKAVVKWDSLVEVGPHSALKAPLVQVMEGVDSKLPSQLMYTSLLLRKEDAVTTAIRAAGALWAVGVKVSLDMVNRDFMAEPKTTSQALVDLPSYPWNHNKTFWHESPATKQQRLQIKPRTDLLGAPVENQNPLEPQWRNQLRVRENPWVEDHKITGTILYPGAGMLIMVIEAVSELASKDKEVQGVEFKNVSFEKGLVIPQDGSTETILRIQLPQSNGTSLSTHSFSIFSRIGDAPWIKNCFGRFKILYKETDSAEAVNGNSPAAFEWKRHLDKYIAMKQLNSTSVDVAKLYKELDNVGMQYGPTFQNVTELYTVPGADFCYGTAKIPDTKSVMPFEYEFTHRIHPATLDAIFHLIVVAVAGGESLTEAAVPSMLEELYISFDLPQGHGQEFIGYAERVKRRDKKLCADLVVSDSEWTAPKVVVKGLIMTKVSSDSGGANDLSHNGEKEKKATKLIWKLDPEFVMQSSSKSSLSNISNLSDWLSLECHKSAQLNVALLGQTINGDVLEDLKPFINGKSPYRGFSHLSVSDISEDALEEWKSQLAATEIPISYLPQEAWTETESKYDLIIVGKGSKDAVDEMNGYRSKMKPNGRLVILYTRRKDSLTNGTNCLNESGENGTSNGHAIKDEDLLKLQLGGGTSTFTVLMDRPQKVPYENEVCLLVPSANEPSKGSQLLSKQLSQSSISTRIVSLKEVASLQDKTVICLLDGSFVSIWTCEEFELFQAMVSSAKNIFWITHGTQMLQPSRRGLEGAGVPGLLRVLRNEFPQVTISHLDLSFELDATDAHGLELVTEAFLQSVTPLAEDEQHDPELAEINGRIFIPRVVPDNGMDMDIALSTGKAQLLRRSLDACGPLQLVISNTRVAETYWEEDKESDKGLNADDVEVAVADISMYPVAPSSESAKSLIGSLVTGTVTQCGASVVDFAEGDTVVVLGLPNCKTIVKQHQSLVAKIECAVPGSAAQVWIELITSYILEHVTHLATGQNILVQDGNTVLGKAIIKRAVKEFSAQVQAIVPSAEQKDQLINQTELSRESVIVSSGTGSSSTLFSHVAEKTNGTGIDVVVYAGSGIPVDEEVARCLSDLARVAIVVTPGHPLISLPPFGGNVSFSTVDPLLILTEQPRLVSTLLKRMADAGSRMPDTVSGTVFDVSELHEAIQTADASDSNGIISVSLLPGSNGIVPEVRVLPAAPEMPKFDKDATYILAGGLGSLGLRIAELMASNGAKHLVFLSRSGGDRHNDKLKKLHGLGCETLVLACDVTSQQSITDMVTEVGKTGRPIKGLLQCAMVLQVC